MAETQIIGSVDESVIYVKCFKHKSFGKKMMRTCLLNTSLEPQKHVINKHFTVKANVYQNLIKLVFSFISNFTDIKSH